MLQYLGRYTHRVAISNHRLVAFSDGRVTFRWRDSTHQNQQRLLTLSVDEFLRRFLRHILPKGFVRIRHFGFLANRKRAALLPVCFDRLGTSPPTSAESQGAATESSTDLHRCPYCGESMVIVQRLTPADILLRSPPDLSVAA